MALLPHYQDAKNRLDSVVGKSKTITLTLRVSHTTEDDDGLVSRRCLGVTVDSVDGDEGGSTMLVNIPDNGMQPMDLQSVLRWLPNYDVVAATDSYMVLRRAKTER